MARCSWSRVLTLALATQLAVGVTETAAQDPEDAEASAPGWADVAELTFLFTGGNAEATTFGFRNELSRVWENAVFSFDAGALRAESSTITRTAVGSLDAFAVTRDSISALTAENYYLRGQYERDINERTFWYVGGGWERNTFAGIDNRYTFGGGVGNTWADTDQRTFKTSYGITVNRQDNVSGADRTFGGLRFGYDHREQLTQTAEFTSVLIADENLSDTGDFRADLLNALSVSMSSQLALKVSWKLLYDAQPSFGAVPLFNLDRTLTGDTVLAELDKVDNFVTFALVATF